MRRMLGWIIIVVVISTCFFYFLASRDPAKVVIHSSLSLWGNTQNRELQYFDKTATQWEAKNPKSDSCGEKLETIKVLTWNVWFGRLEQRKRGLSIIETVNDLSPAIACFQEVTEYFLDQLKSDSRITNNYFFSDDATQQTLGSYGVLMLWKKSLPTRSLRLVSLPTRMSRSLLLLETSFDCENSFWIGTVHLESMEPNAAARKAQIEQITEILQSIDDTSILVGDFNFCGTWQEENKNIPADFTDVWPYLRPHDNGWTEDTHINIMRYNQKHKHKQVRFDRTLLRSPGNIWQPREIQIIGTSPVPLLDEIWPSDHFGLISEFRGKF